MKDIKTLIFKSEFLLSYCLNIFIALARNQWKGNLAIKIAHARSQKDMLEQKFFTEIQFGKYKRPCWEAFQFLNIKLIKDSMLVRNFLFL